MAPQPMGNPDGIEDTLATVREPPPRGAGASLEKGERPDMSKLPMLWGLLFCALCAAQTADNVVPTPASSPSQDRFLLPHNFVRGYVDFQLAPPHNELDLGLCDFNRAPNPGAGPCAAFARYVWSGYMELQPFGRTPLKRLFLIWEPKLFNGNNVPQQSYTASSAPILMEHSVGAGIALPGQFELRMLHHWADVLGRYAATPSAATFHSDGPYGLNTTVGVRWYFGGYGRANAH
jgi:hypothetical protein